MDLFTKQSSFIKYRYDSTRENVEGFDLIRFINNNTAVRISATYTNSNEVEKINGDYMIRTIELIDRRVGYPNWIDLSIEDIEKYNMKEIDNKAANEIIKEAIGSILNVL
jgi:hypothetical protein